MTIPKLKYKTRYIFWDWVNLFFLQFFPFLGQNLGHWSLNLLKFRFFKCFVSKSVEFFAGAGRSQAFIGGARAENLYLEPEPKNKYLEPEARKNSSAPQHWYFVLGIKLANSLLRLLSIKSSALTAWIWSTGDNGRQGTWDRRCETEVVIQETWDRRCETGEVRQETWDRRRETRDRRRETGDGIQETRYVSQETGDKKQVYWVTKLWARQETRDGN